MKFTFTCKKISLNDSVKAYAEKKIGKLEKYFKEEPEATVTFAVEKKNRCIVEVMLRGANGTLFRAVCEDADGDMRGAIDEAVGQIEPQDPQEQDPPCQEPAQRGHRARRPPRSSTSTEEQRVRHRAHQALLPSSP